MGSSREDSLDSMVDLQWDASASLGLKYDGMTIRGVMAPQAKSICDFASLERRDSNGSVGTPSSLSLSSENNTNYNSSNGNMISYTQHPHHYHYHNHHHHYQPRHNKRCSCHRCDLLKDNPQLHDCCKPGDCPRYRRSRNETGTVTGCGYPLPPHPLSLELYHGTFVDVEEAGHGSVGVVYKALHLRTQLVFARKEVTCRLTSAKQRQAIASELGILQLCNSPHIIRCYGATCRENQVSLALEWMDLGSFQDLLRAYGPLPEVCLSAVAHGLLHALLYLWEALGVLHRDVKPSNILLNHRGEIKLCDFSEAIQLVGGSARSAVGTIGYMSPERIRGEPYSIRSELWSLGITLVELATGKFPYALTYPNQRHAMDPVTEPDMVVTGEHDGTSPTEIWEAILNEPSPTLSRQHFSPELCDLVDWCLVKDQRERIDIRSLFANDFVRRGATADAFRQWICQHGITKTKPP